MSDLLFKRKLLATAITLATATTAQAGLVRADVDYQYYRDFGENKGLFRLNGDTPVNAEIVDKQGKSLGTVLEGVPMIDLAVGSRGDGIATLVDPQYVVSVQHNVGYQTVQFGDHSSNNLDSHHFDYQVTDRHLKAPGVGIGSWHRDDYHSPRLHKLVTEVAPISIANETHIGAYLDKEKYPVFVRSGGGTQRALEQPGNVEKDVAGPYLFVTGGEMLDLIEVVADSVTNIPGNSKQTLMRIKGFDDLHNHPLGIMQRRGDSGSGVFAWDAQAKRWVYAMSVQSSTPSQSFSIAHLGFMEENRQKAIAGEISATGKTLNWTPTGNTSTITGGDAPLTVGLYDPALLERDGEKNAQGVASSQWHRPRQNAGKTFTITGDDNVLKLTNNVNQGSGAIYFKGNTTVEGATANTTWLGAGVSVDKDKTVTWKVHNPDQDRLSKIGEGTLLVQGTGKNMGAISVGDGKVILDQKADANNQKQAFDEVGIVSGRPTVVLNSSDQVNPDSIYFGFRGGRLDVNGNDLTFNRIQNADSGARIVNHNMTDSAKVTLNRTKNFSSSGDVPFETNRRNTHTPVGFYAAPRADGTTDYFVLKEGRRPNVSFPTGKTDGPSWIYLASGTKQDAIRAFLELKKNDPLVAKKDAFFGFLGETDDSKNGRLDVEYNPTLKDDLYILNGGSNLNGTLAVKNGTLMLSGTPVPHAYDHLNNKDVVKDDEWIDRHFTASNFQVTGGVLTTSRNVGSITGDINASEQGRVNLGVVNGETEYCYRSDYSGVVHCSATAIADNLIVPVNVKGNATASDTAHIQIANSNIVGNVRASNQATITIKDNTTISDGVTLADTAKLNFANSKNALTKVTGSRHSQVNMQAGSHWQLADNSTVGQLTGETGSQISLNSSKPDTYQQLTVNGDLFGNLTFNMATDLAQGKADKLVVNGYANGNHELAVQNTGNEAKVDELTLVELRHGAQESGDAQFALVGGEVHAGALRYTLETDASNRYFLYNPTKADELAKQRQAEAEKARQAEEQAKKTLEDAVKAREDAEKALAEALKNSGANAQDLADAQKRAEDAQKLAEQADKEKRQLETQLAEIRTQLQTAEQQKTEAERLKNQADTALQTANAEKTRLQGELDTANRLKQQAETEKANAEKAKSDAQKLAQQAQNEKTTAEQNLAKALSDKEKAESDKTKAQTELANLQTQKTDLEKRLTDAQNSQTASGQELTELRNQLNQANAQISAKEQELQTAETLKNQAIEAQTAAQNARQTAEQNLANAQSELATANRAKDEAISRANDAETAKNQAQQNLEQVQNQLNQAIEDKNAAQAQAQTAETARQTAENAKKALEEAQIAQAAALKEAQDAQKQADEARQLAEQAKERAEQAQTAAVNEKNQAVSEKNQAINDKNQALTDKQKAEQDLANAQKQVADAQKQAEQANADKLTAQNEANRQAELARLAETAKTTAEQNLATAQNRAAELQNQLNQANSDKAKAQSDLQTAQNGLTTAQNEKKALEEALKLAQSQGSDDVAKLQNELLAANTRLAQKQSELTAAETAKQTAETNLANKEQELAGVNAELVQANADKQKAEQDKQTAETARQTAQNEANRQAELVRLAETAKTTAEQNLATAQTNLDNKNKELASVQAQLAQEQTDKQTAQNRADELQNQLNQANADKTQAQNALQTAQNSLNQAQNEKKALEDALKLAEQNGSADVAKLADELAKANAEIAQKQGELATAQTNLDNKNKELASVQTQLAEVNADKNRIEQDLSRVQSEKQASDLAKQKAEQAQKLAEEAKNQALSDLATAQTAQAQAELAKQSAQDAEKLAMTARDKALSDLDKANSDKAKAQSDLQTAQNDLTTAQNEKKALEEALKLAEQNGSADVAKLTDELAKANAQIAQKQQELTNAETAKSRAETAQKSAETQRDNALALLNQANQAKEVAENTLTTVRNQLAQAEKAKQDADLAKEKAEQDKRAAENNARQAEADKRMAEEKEAYQAKLVQEAQQAQQLAELSTQNAKNAEKLANDARINAENAKAQADEARRAVELINERLTANAQADQATIAQIQSELDLARQSLTKKDQALTLAQKQADDAQSQLLVIQNQTHTLESKLTQANTLTAQAEQAKEEALIAKREAENAKQLAVDAQNKSEAEKKQAQDNLVKAEQLVKDKEAKLVTLEEQKQALTKDIAKLIKVQENLQATLSAQTTQYDALKAELEEIKAEDDLAKAEAERLRAELAKAEAERLATLAQNKKQHELISQYANTALSEVSASAHHLMNMGEGVNERLLTLNRMHANDSNNNGNNTNTNHTEPQSAIWAHTNAQKTKHASELYRGYEQDTQLTQLGLDITRPTQSGTMTVGASLNHLTHDADYADNFTSEGQTTTGTIYTKWQNDTGLAFTADISAGQAKSDIKQGNTTNDIHVPNIKRDVASIGVGMAKTWQAVGTVDVQVHAGLKHHTLGEANYDIHVQDGTKVNVKQDNIDITSLNAGVNVGKHLQTQNGLIVRPNVGINYRHTNSDAVVHINNQALAQKFDSELHTKAGITMSNNTWELDIHIDHTDGKETSSRVGGGVGVSWRF